MSYEEKIKLANGIEGYVAADPGKPGRHLWSVKFPKIDRELNDAKELVTPGKPEAYRYGYADSRDQALIDLNAAARMGRPTRADAKGQFVMAEPKTGTIKPSKGRNYVAKREAE